MTKEQKIIRAKVGLLELAKQLGVAVVSLVGAILLEQNDEWAVPRTRDMSLETMAALGDDPIVGLPAMVI